MTDLLPWTIEVAFAATPNDVLSGLADDGRYDDERLSRVTWTDLGPVVRMVDGVEAVRGRASDQSAMSAGSLRFKVNNDSGAFTPGRTDLLLSWIQDTFATVDDYVEAYPEFLLDPSLATLHGKPVRLVYDPDGTPAVLWTGVVEAVESGWTSGIRGVVSVRAVDAVALAGQTVMRSLPVAGILLGGPAWLYPLDEAEGPCADIVGRGPYGTSAAPLQVHSIGWPSVIEAELTFEGSSPGSIPGQAESTVPTFNGADANNGWCLDTRPRPLFDLPDLTPGVLGAAVAVSIAPGLPGRARTALTVLGSGRSHLAVRVTATNLVQVTVGDAGLTTSLTTSTAILPNTWTHVAVNLEADSGTVYVTLFIDGVAKKTGSLAAPMTGLGRRQIIVGAGDNLTQPWDGQIANAAGFARILDSIPLGYGSDYGEGETTTARTSRLLLSSSAYGYGYTPPVTGSSTMCHQHTKDQTLAAALDVVAQAEASSWWALPVGPITMGSRATYWNAAADLTLPALAVDAATGFTLDTTEVVNTVTVKRPGGATVVRTNSASVDKLRTQGGTSIDLHVASDAEAEAYADDLVARYGSPVPRTATLAVDVVATQATIDPADVLGTDIDQVVEVTDLPADAPDTSLRFVVLGITDRIGAAGWSRTFNVGRTPMLSDVWVLGTSTLDDTTLLAL